MKVLSKRPRGEAVLDDVARLQRTLNRLRGASLIPRGIFRFTSFEAADEWMMRQMVRTAALPRARRGRGPESSEPSDENLRAVKRALATLPDNAAEQLADAEQTRGPG